MNQDCNSSEFEELRPDSIEEKSTWSRTDKLAAWAIVISVLSALLTIPLTIRATNVASSADERAHQAEVQGTKAVVAMLIEGVKLLSQDAEYSGAFLEGFIAHAGKHPENLRKAQYFTIELLNKTTLPEVIFSPEQMTLLAHAGNDAATKLALCVSRRNEVQVDIKKVAVVRNYKATSDQSHTMQMLPYRLNVLKEDCERAVKELEKIVPDYVSVERPLRGTIGELAAAQKMKMLREQSGLVVKLESAKAGK